MLWSDPVPSDPRELSRAEGLIALCLIRFSWRAFELGLRRPFVTMSSPFAAETSSSIVPFISLDISLSLFLFHRMSSQMSLDRSSWLFVSRWQSTLGADWVTGVKSSGSTTGYKGHTQVYWYQETETLTKKMVDEENTVAVWVSVNSLVAWALFLSLFLLCLYLSFSSLQ